MNRSFGVALVASGLALILSGCPSGESPAGTPGAAGQSVTVTTEAPGANCALGGVAVTSASGTRYVCNGAGTTGASGTPGAAGTAGAPGTGGARGTDGAAGGGLTWHSISTPTTGAANAGYVVTAPTTVTLPPSADLSIGQEIDVIGLGVGFDLVPSGSDTIQYAEGVLASPWADRSIGTPSHGLQSWTGVAMDATGQHVAATAFEAGIWTSSLYGGSLAAQPNAAGQEGTNFSNISSDSTGANLLVPSSGWAIWTSTDYGVNWNGDSPDAGHSFPQWGPGASDATGTHVFVDDEGHSAYIGVKTGSTWAWTEQTGLGASIWAGCASDATGTNLAVITAPTPVEAADNIGYLFTTPDSGATWVQQDSPGQQAWRSVAISFDGLTVVATAEHGHLWRGVNSSGSWSWSDIPHGEEVEYDGDGSFGQLDFSSVAIASDGTLYVVGTGDLLRGTLVDDFEWTFTNLTNATPVAGDVKQIAINADGTRIAAIANDDLWTYSASPSFLSGSANSIVRMVYVGGGAFYVSQTSGYIALQ